MQSTCVNETHVFSATPKRRVSPVLLILPLSHFIFYQFSDVLTHLLEIAFKLLVCSYQFSEGTSCISFVATLLPNCVPDCHLAEFGNYINDCLEIRNERSTMAPYSCQNYIILLIKSTGMET